MTEHECKLTRTQQDADTFHEFLNWLTAGGMSDLREISRFAAGMRAAQKTALGATIVVIVGGIGAIIAAGINAMFRGTGQ